MRSLCAILVLLLMPACQEREREPGREDRGQPIVLPILQ